MITISVAEIQKNISLFTKMTDIVELIDKRRNIKVATIYPANQTNTIEKLAGKYKDRVKKVAMFKAVKEKYGKLN